MRNWLFFLMFSFVFLSCKKEYHVVGRVYNPITGEGYANVKVEFSRSTIGELPGGNEEVTSTITNGDGFYEIKYKGRAERVKLDGTDEFYELGTLYTGVYQQAIALDHTKIQWVDWHIVPYGNLIIHFKNINCTGPDDTLRLFLDGSAVGFDNVQIGLLTELYGCIDIEDQPVKFPMGERYYHWEIIRGGITTVVYDTVYVQPNQTTILEVFY